MNKFNTAVFSPRSLLDQIPRNHRVEIFILIGNAQWDTIGTFRDSPTDLCIAGTLLSIAGPVSNLVMGRKNLE